MPHTLEWYDHADPPKRGNFEHVGDDMLDPDVLAKFAEHLLKEAGVSYEPPIRVLYTSTDHRILEPPHERLFWSVLQPPPGQTKDSSV